LLGLDGATFDLLMPWVREGKLPHLKRILSSSAYGELNSTIPCTTPVAWSTVFTGKNAGKHSIYDFRESFHRNQKRPLISLKSIQGATLWHIFSHFGKRSVLLNVPLTYPPEPLNGVMVSGMMTPDENVDYTFPLQLKKEISARFPNYRINIDISKYDTRFHQDALSFLEEVEKSFSTRRDLLFYLMENERWDFLFAVFVLPDRIQHLFWKYIDPKNDSFRSSKAGKEIYERIVSLYSMEDKFLGEIYDNLAPQDYLFIISDHGFGGTDAYINVNTLLQNWGYLKVKHKAISKKAFFKLWRFGESKPIAKLMPDNIQRLIRKTIRKRRSSFRSEIEELVDYGRTKAFFGSIPSQGIYINIERDKRGIPKNRSKYDIIRNDIKNRLLEIIDPSDGKRVIDTVYFAEELFYGDFVKWAPDIIFIARNYSYLGRQHIGLSENISYYFNEPNGFHRREGIFIAVGPDIESKNINSDLNLQDIAPTVLYALGHPIPIDMDGETITEIFNSKRLDIEEIKKIEKINFNDGWNNIYSDEEAERIYSRLRSLGYIE